MCCFVANASAALVAQAMGASDSRRAGHAASATASGAGASFREEVTTALDSGRSCFGKARTTAQRDVGFSGFETAAEARAWLEKRRSAASEHFDLCINLEADLDRNGLRARVGYLPGLVLRFAKFRRLCGRRVSAVPFTANWIQFDSGFHLTI